MIMKDGQLKSLRLNVIEENHYNLMEGCQTKLHELADNISNSEYMVILFTVP